MAVTTAVYSVGDSVCVGPFDRITDTLIGTPVSLPEFVAEMRMYRSMFTSLIGPWMMRVVLSSALATVRAPVVHPLMSAADGKFDASSRTALIVSWFLR